MSDSTGSNALPSEPGSLDSSKSQVSEISDGISTEPRPSQGWLSGGPALLIGLGLGLAIAFIGTRFMASGGSESQEPPAATAAAQSVSVESVQSATIDQTIDATGTVEAFDLLTITPEISGLEIRSVLVREGDSVSGGQPLVVLDGTILEAQIREAEAQIASAEAQVRQRQASLAQAIASSNEADANLTRYSSLADRGAISQEELDSRSTEAITTQESVGLARANIESARANVASEQANLERLRAQLNKTIIRAPVAGTIAESSATVGDVSSNLNELFRIIQSDQLELAVEVPQTQLSQIAVGAPVKITASADERIQLEGSIRQINPLVDADTRIATVVISLPNSPLLRPGMFLNASIVTGSRQGLAVPAEAVLPQPDGTYQVYSVNADETVTVQTVAIGDRISATPTQPARIEITQGLESGTRVVSQGASYLTEGDRINIVED
ncbi:MAG: efflux RND transporter periplasmic adaptor subunit [Cyanobacteria bacterium P01_H01_bin.119]